MAISASQIVQVLPRVLKGTGQDLVFNGMVLDKNGTLPARKPVSFASASDVGDYFGTKSAEYDFASVYFGGFDNSQLKPGALYFYRQNDAAAAPFVRGATITPADTLAALKATENGALAIKVNGVRYEIGGLNFSGAGSLSQCAEIINDALTDAARAVSEEEEEDEVTGGEGDDTTDNTGTGDGENTGENTGTDTGGNEGGDDTGGDNTGGDTPATGDEDDNPDAEISAPCTLTFSSQFNAFTFTADTAGTEYSIGIPEGDVATLLGFAGTVTESPGVDGADVTATMNEIIGGFQNFVTVTTLWEPSDDEALALSAWAAKLSSSGNMFLYVCWDSDPACLDANNQTCIAERLNAENAGATCVVYPSYRLAAFVMGVAASIDWSQPNGTLTLAFKAQDGLAADITATADANALQAHKINYMGNYATRNDQFVFFYNGAMFGSWQWIDTYLNAIWLCNAAQVQILAMFIANRRIPYNEDGYALIRANIKDVLDRAVTNGVINPGVTLSNAQKATLTAELGGDFSDEIYTNGYYMQVLDADAGTRQARKSPPCNLVYTYGGAVHNLTLPALAVV